MSVHPRLPVAFCALLAFGLFLFVAAQTDGNPHHWDRRRRCDAIDYDPPCGICEGYGGLPYGDENDQIDLTTCEIVAKKEDIDPSTLKRPIWHPTFTLKKYYEVLVGKKTDPFCFNSFPNNSSIGPLCYRHQQGSQKYNAYLPYHALRYDVEVETVIGNITSTVIHQDKYMWIVNKLPWFVANTRQCICTYPRPPNSPEAYPIQYNWTDNLEFVGRERIGVEFIQQTQVLDHWFFGPHHVWTFPDSGQILRMWQPFNGLEVFPEGLNDTSVDNSTFDGLPPSFCKKGGSLFRIGCTDDGYPSQDNGIELSGPFLLPSSLDTAAIAEKDDGPSPMEIRRAVQKVPRHTYKGQSFSDMSRVLNGWLDEMDHVTTRPCDEWTAQEIQQLQALLYTVRHLDFDAIYHNTTDNRRIQKDLEEMSQMWGELNEMASGDDRLAQMQRDGHCHEAVMWYVHHLTDSVKMTLKDANLVIPLLSYNRHSCPDDVDEKSKELCRVYSQQVTCASCHANVTAPIF